MRTEKVELTKNYGYFLTGFTCPHCKARWKYPGGATYIYGYCSYCGTPTKPVYRYVTDVVECYLTTEQL